MRLLWILLLAAAPLAAERYALLLEDAPAAAGGARTRVLAAQTGVRSQLAQRNVQVTGAVERILNAVFVEVPPERAAELRAMPGVRGVVPMRRRTLKLDRAAELMNAPAAWSALGGVTNAGAGVKIAVIDTGIEHTHPAFQDSTLNMPAGYPLCSGGDCRFTSNKVIVARSYVPLLALGSYDLAARSRPDDLSPRDRVGHGTAVAMVAAGAPNTGPAGAITGMAPKAWLGNYKIFGSPGINDGTTSDLVIMALEQALEDGMDVAVLALGGPALFGPLDTGAACGMPAGVPCDPEAVAIENVIREGLVVVAAAGNEADLGEEYPTLSSISAPATAPSVIAAGATTNGHIFVNGVRVPGDDVPQNLRLIPARFGDGPVPDKPLTAPLRDAAAAAGDIGTACGALPAGSFTGAFALIRRGDCLFGDKANNARQAGAVGVVFYLSEPGSLITPVGLDNAGIPAMMISFEAGTALRGFLAAHPDHPVTLDPGPAPIAASGFDNVAYFSSRGPNIGSGDVKPDIVAVGTDLYMATQTFDPEGDMYDPSGYLVANGTSFSAPMVAGAVALVKQRNPTFSTAQLRSAVINTASPTVLDGSKPAALSAAGPGKLDIAAALRTTVTAKPATIAFGVIDPGTQTVARTLTLTNHAASTAVLTVTVDPAEMLGHVTLDRTSLTLAGSASTTLNVTLNSSALAPGSYEGALVVAGGATTLRVPYLYLVSDGNPYNIFPLFGDGFVGVVGEQHPHGQMAFRVVDQYGVGVPNLDVRFQEIRGGTVLSAERVTNRYGIAKAAAVLGAQPGQQEFRGLAGGLSVTFLGFARNRPTIAANGVVNAASFAAERPVAPGSYISIFGTGLSNVSRAASTATLPISLAGTNVSFDAPGVSVPGNLWYVSPQQVNVQVPWELAGKDSALVKVNIRGVSGQLATVRLAAYSPAVFEYTEGGTRLAVAQDSNYQLITPQNPASPNDVIIVYCNGLGPVNDPPASGEPSPFEPLARTPGIPAVTIGGRSADVTFSGLTPGSVGLYQVNVKVPDNVPAGTHPLIVSIGEFSSPPVNLPVAPKL